jgi:hypothetical protein
LPTQRCETLLRPAEKNRATLDAAKDAARRFAVA